MTLLLILILLPAVIGVISWFISANKLRRQLWILTAFVHLALSLQAALYPPQVPSSSWIGIDALSVIFLPLTSFLFFIVSVYGSGYVAREPADQGPLPEEEGRLNNTSESVFTGTMLIFLATMSMSILSQHLGMQWMAIEATTLASAPLIYYHRNRNSLAAAWKYLILCSVGIAIALAGIFFLGLGLPAGMQDLTMSALLHNASLLNPRWLELAFILMLVGYGTKMGLAPMHNWLPEAHSEASSPVSALLSGSLLNCAFLGILRIQQLNAAAGKALFGQELLILFGLLSIGVASIFILGQTDYKRMLAYSSVEHMGILALGTGIGGLGALGAILHLINHSVAKTMLFLTAGNIHSRYHTKIASHITGLGKSMPITGFLWLAGFLGVVASPPLGIFISEFTIIRAISSLGMWLVLGLLMLFLTLAFIGMANMFLKMYFGKPDVAVKRENRSGVIPIFILVVILLALGFYVPHWLWQAISNAVQLIEGVKP